MAAFGKSWRGVVGPSTVRYVVARVGLAGFSMLRTCLRVIALIAMVASLSMTAQAADSTLTLACDGTVTLHEYVRTTIV